MAPPTCFVIMPFRVREEDLTKYENDRNHWNEVYSGLITPAIEAAEMMPMRDDDDVSSRLIVDGIWRKLENADVVLCDLSSHNPNVYLELGWALRADKKFILIKDTVTPYSFDLNQLHTFEYDQRLQPTVVRKQIVDLANALKATIQDESAAYSLVRRIALSKRIEDYPLGDEKDAMLELILQKLDGIIEDRVTRRASSRRSSPLSVSIVNTGRVYPSINETDALDWPSDEIKRKAGKNAWAAWRPKKGMIGRVIHESWHPSTKEIVYIVEVDGHFAAIGKSGTEQI
jgi:hypothetical protein